MRIYLVAGEASGDLHGASLILALRQQQDVRVRGIGGDRMAAAGMELLLHYRQTAFMGFWEVLRHLPRIVRALRQTQSDITQWQPDVLVLIDYPGFNLRLARWAHQRGLKVVYYIAPQLWAWHAARVRLIRKYVDCLLVILPFEPAFFRQHGVEAIYVGHPLLDILGQETHDRNRQPRLVALLPGSRRQEVAAMLPTMLKAAAGIKGVEIAVAGLSSVGQDFYHRWLHAYPQVQLWLNRTHELLRRASAAVVTSGTATLETALLGVPQVVCYRGSELSYQIARRLVRVPYISLVNLIVNRPLLRELVQHQVRAPVIAEELNRLLDDEAYRDGIKAGYMELRQLLGGPGASHLAAQYVLHCPSRKA
ncbi:MAG: lipid-A-disaccharide synthase [Chitinophagales bacterium]|nr:lipid-A-disaccharide synthase [Chitinophagales bacterium]MDW8427695.1 lipid-A-disaccharide synthase [Chitinophagales bacterium]